MHSRRKVFAMTFLVLLALAFTTWQVPAVRAAIQRWFGYVPGAGLVSSDQIRVLADPVVVEQEGVTLTVKQVWATADKTVVQYSVEGWERGSGDAGCDQIGLLRLDDRDLAVMEAPTMIGWEDGYEIVGAYAAIPADIDMLTLVVPCMAPTSAGDWEVPLNLIAAPENMTVYPVIENAAPAETVPAAQPQKGTDLSAEGLTLVIDRAAEMDDGYLLFATMTWKNTGLGWVDIPDPAALRLTDANGKLIPYHVDYQATNPLMGAAPAGQITFALQTETKPAAGPLTLTLDTISAHIITDAGFTVDPGSDPESGQSWTLDQDIELGYGYSLRVKQVTYNLPDADYVQLNVRMESESGVTGASLQDPADPMASSEAGDISEAGVFTTNLYYPTPLPQDPLSIAVTSFTVNLPGNWQATWAPE
ncbi:hypothetical protein Pelsub_P0642 [Pelolinea submarina]|nr:hypothetical protein Pelsub_P0642 [Pelolinea submarina]